MQIIISIPFQGRCLHVICSKGSRFLCRIRSSVRFDRLEVWEKSSHLAFATWCFFSWGSESVSLRFFVMANLPALHFGFLLINLTSTSARHRIYDLAKTYFRPVPPKCCVCGMSYGQSGLSCSWLIIAVSRLRNPLAPHMQYCRERWNSARTGS